MGYNIYWSILGILLDSVSRLLKRHLPEFKEQKYIINSILKMQTKC